MKRTCNVDRLFMTFIITLGIFCIPSCEKEADKPTGNNKVMLATTTMDSLGYFNVNASCSFTQTGGQALEDHGFCYGNAPNPDINSTVKSLGKRTDPGDFSAELTNLEDNKKYYIRAFATIAGGTLYAEQKEITTLKSGKPRISTVAVSNITPAAAVCGGVIESDSGYAVTASGICWDIDNQFNEDQCLGKAVNTSGATSYIMNIEGLTEGTNYFVKAFATNQKGTGYGEISQFSTVPVAIPDVTTANITNPTTNSATGGGNVPNSGNATVTARGVCWNTTANPTLKNCLGFTTDGQGTGSFTSNITNLADGVKYYVVAYATNSKGTGYGAQVDFTTLPITLPTVITSGITNPTTNSATGGGNVTDSGNATVTARGVCWNTTGNPTLQNCISFTANGSGTGPFISSITGLSDGVTYFVKAYATNVEGTTYGTQVNFTTLAITLPTVTTTAITNPTTNSATGGGNVTNAGNATVTARGVCWNTTGNPTLQNCINFTTNGSGTGSFTSNLTGLSPSTTYFVRAYATNIIGSAYGNPMSFTTDYCGLNLSITHTAGSVAPVSKTVNYSTVETNLTGSNKCWITQNLGANHQATAATDNTEASAGWYWQFNRKQGYKHDGTTRTPNATWITSINENGDWLPANDPCSLLLGNGWRLPTNTEWQTADNTGGWDNFNETFASELKLHTAGGLNSSDGSLNNRGSSGTYWSSSQSDLDYGRNLYFYSGGSFMSYYYKENGFSARCLRD